MALGPAAVLATTANAETKVAVNNGQFYIPKEVLSALQTGDAKTSSGWKWSLVIIWLGVVTAASPSWNKQSTPAVQNQKLFWFLTIISNCWLRTLADRLSRAQFKLIDVLRQRSRRPKSHLVPMPVMHTWSALTVTHGTIELYCLR
jgi:hypothetical protein